MGAMLSITGHLRNGCLLGEQAPQGVGIREAPGAQRKEVSQAALGRAFKLLVIGSGFGLVLGLLATKVLAFIVYQATRRDPLVLAGVVLAMAALGLLAAWIPAQRALSGIGDELRRQGLPILLRVRHQPRSSACLGESVPSRRPGAFEPILFKIGCDGVYEPKSECPQLACCQSPG
jgi:hypothetical protein